MDQQTLTPADFFSLMEEEPLLLQQIAVDQHEAPLALLTQALQQKDPVKYGSSFSLRNAAGLYEYFYADEISSLAGTLAKFARAHNIEDWQKMAEQFSAGQAAAAAPAPAVDLPYDFQGLPGQSTIDDEPEEARVEEAPQQRRVAFGKSQKLNPLAPEEREQHEARMEVAAKANLRMPVPKSALTRRPPLPPKPVAPRPEPFSRFPLATADAGPAAAIKAEIALIRDGVRTVGTAARLSEGVFNELFNLKVFATSLEDEDFVVLSSRIIAPIALQIATDMTKLSSDLASARKGFGSSMKSKDHLKEPIRVRLDNLEKLLDVRARMVALRMDNTALDQAIFDSLMAVVEGAKASDGKAGEIAHKASIMLGTLVKSPPSVACNDANRARLNRAIAYLSVGDQRTQPIILVLEDCLRDAQRNKSGVATGWVDSTVAFAATAAGVPAQFVVMKSSSAPAALGGASAAIPASLAPIARFNPPAEESLDDAAPLPPAPPARPQKDPALAARFSASPPQAAAAARGADDASPPLLPRRVIGVGAPPPPPPPPRRVTVAAAPQVPARNTKPFASSALDAPSEVGMTQE